jgi:hypothetical protein
MFMKRRNLVCLGLASAALCVTIGLSLAAGPAEKDPAMTAFMRQKLAFTQGVTEGLSLGQFDLVTKNAVKLRDMTQTNVWTRVGNPEYARLTKEHRGTIEALYKAGTERQLKAATDAYAKTLRSCVGCHRVLRAETIKGRK